MHTKMSVLITPYGEVLAAHQQWCATNTLVSVLCTLNSTHTCTPKCVWIAHKIRIEILCSTNDGIYKDNSEGTKIRNTQCTLSFARRWFTVGEALSDLNFNKTTSKKEYKLIHPLG